MKATRADVEGFLGALRGFDPGPEGAPVCCHFGRPGELSVHLSLAEVTPYSRLCVGTEEILVACPKEGCNGFVLMAFMTRFYPPTSRFHSMGWPHEFCSVCSRAEDVEAMLEQVFCTVELEVEK